MSRKPEALRKAISKIRDHRQLTDPEDFANRIRRGDRAALANAFTFLESTRDEHKRFALALLSLHSGAVDSFRIGITGVPGVGKSTMIEALGLHFIAEGHKVAVLAVDPSSPVSSGSILGDKTRMQQLSMNDDAFIRPTAAARALGGVASDTKLAIQLCEMAGYNRIIVETVGVGQSEVAVHGMTDMFVLLMLAGAGDQLQGIKRGIVELCDAMVITKADGANLSVAQHARAEYISALHLISPKNSGWIPEVVTGSAFTSEGLQDVTRILNKYWVFMKERGIIKLNRNEQDLRWLIRELSDRAFERWLKESDHDNRLREIEKLLMNGEPIAKLMSVMNVYG